MTWERRYGLILIGTLQSATNSGDVLVFRGHPVSFHLGASGSFSFCVMIAAPHRGSATHENLRWGGRGVGAVVVWCGVSEYLDDPPLVPSSRCTAPLCRPDALGPGGTYTSSISVHIRPHGKPPTGFSSSLSLGGPALRE